MKTVYEVLKTYDRKKIVDEYLYTYGPFFWEIAIDDTHTPKEIRDKLEEKINHHIDYLLTFTPKPSTKDVLLAYHVIPDSNLDDVNYVLVDLEEKEGEFTPTSYAFEFSPTEEILGFLVSDAYTTQYYLTELLAYFLNESSFFGWMREGLEEERNTLDKAMEEIESGEATLIPAGVVMDNLKEDWDWVPENRNEAEQEREMEIMRIIWRYNKDCLKREIEETKKLMEEGKE